MTTVESTVFEKLFHEDQPIGGSGTGISVPTPCAIKGTDTEKTMPAERNNAACMTRLAIETGLFDIRNECTPGDGYCVSLAALRPNKRNLIDSLLQAACTQEARLFTEAPGLL